MSIYLHKVKSRWQPGENTLLYVPMDEDLNDHSGNEISITNTWITLDTQELQDIWVWYFRGNSDDWLTLSWLSFWSNDFTISWWEKTLSTSTSTWSRFCSTWDWWSNRAWLLLWYQWTYLYVWTWWTTWNIISWTQVFSSTANEWVHWTITREWTNWKTYRNWALFQSTTGSGSVWSNTSVIWNYRPWDKNPYYWYMSQFIVEDTAWSADEITDYYMLTKWDYHTETHWEVNENTLAYYLLESNANDSSWNENHITNYNFTFDDNWYANFNWSQKWTIPNITWYKTISFWCNATEFNFMVFSGDSDYQYYPQIQAAKTSQSNWTSSHNYDASFWRTIDTWEWHLFTLTQDNWYVNLYLDWTLYNTRQCPAFSRAIKNIWRWQYRNRYYMNWKLSNVIIESQARTADEALSYYYQTRNNYIDDPWYPVKEYEVQNIYIWEETWKPNDNTIAYYKFENNINDSSWNNRNLSMKNWSFSYWTVWNKYYVNISQSAWTNWLSSFPFNTNSNTVNFWLNTSYFTKSESNAMLADFWRGWSYWVSRLQNKSWTIAIDWISYSLPTYDIWYNVCITYDNNQTSLYINWTLIWTHACWLASWTTSISLALNNAPDTNSTTYSSQWLISEMIFESVVRSVDDIAKYYNSTKSNYGL